VATTTLSAIGAASSSPGYANAPAMRQAIGSGDRLLYLARPPLQPPQTGQRPSDIYVMNDDGTGRRRLTSTRLNELNAFASPDGKLIAFTRGHREHGSEIYAMRPDGRGVRRIGPGRLHEHPWSPDGKKLLYTSHDFRGTGVMSRDGRNRRLLTTGGEDVSPRWSPSGREIVLGRLVRVRGVSLGLIFVVDVKSGRLRRVARGEQTYGNVWWSPDGRELFFVRALYGVPVEGEGLYRMRVDGTAKRLVFPGYVWRFALSSTGQIAVSTAGGFFISHDLEGKDVTHVSPEWWSLGGWSRDGSQILFLSDREEIMLTDAAGANPRRLSAGAGLRFTAASWLPSP
jgi:Tol biopolymer transport system component